jgi:hypothetical protein
MNNEKFTPVKLYKGKVHLTVCVFEFEVNTRIFSTHWERTKNSNNLYNVNIFRGGGYHVSYPANVSPNQSNAETFLRKFLNDYPQDFGTEN